MWVYPCNPTTTLGGNVTLIWQHPSSFEPPTSGVREPRHPYPAAPTTAAALEAPR